MNVKLKLLLWVLFATSIFFTGFGAEPSKPDFAFPKTVSANAGKNLDAALKANNGPATVRSLIDWGLAQVQIDRDSTTAVDRRMEQVQREVSEPTTKAMIQMVRADVTGNDTLLVDVIKRYTSELRGRQTRDWSSVVVADVRYVPSLYDFAVAMAVSRNVDGSDSIAAEAIKWNVDRLYPRFYLGYLQCSGFDDYMRLYGEFAGQSVSAYALAAASRSAAGLANEQAVFESCNRWLTDFSDNSLAEVVRKSMAYLTAPSLDVEAPGVTVPDAALAVHVRAKNLRKATLHVRRKLPTGGSVVDIPLTFSGEGVFVADTIVEFPAPGYGEYEIKPEFAGQTVERRPQTAEFIVTSFLLSRTVYGTKEDIFALDALNGTKLDDVEFTRLERNRVRGTRGADRYSPYIYSSGQRHEQSDTAWNYTANVLTDRAIYHPGDTLRFVATAMASRRLERKLLVGHAVEAVLRNANGEIVGKQTYVSDEFGRVNGEFALPSDGLTGNFSLSLTNLNSAWVLVTDYKAPTFEVDVNSTRIDSTCVELDGTVVGFNGFPIADAQVVIDVKKLPRWVWFRNYRNQGQETLLTDTVTTDVQGKFHTKIVIPPGQNLYALATASSPTGETHEATCFIASRRYFISADIPQVVEAGHAPAFTVMDARGEPADVALGITMTNVLDSTVVVPDDKWDNVPSGQYRLEAVAADADTLTAEVAVYRVGDKMPPLTSSLFVPRVSVNSGEKLLAGTSYPDSHILYTLWTPERIIEQRWLAPQQGNFMLDVVMPDSIDSATLTLTTLRNYQSSCVNVSVRRPDMLSGLNLQISSMRDRMTPGECETWTVKVTDNLGNHVKAAVMFDVYSKALDALASLRWQFNPAYTWGNRFSQMFETVYPSNARVWKRVVRPDGLRAANPSFELYGLHWPGRFRLYYIGKSAMVTMARAPMASAMAVADATEEVVEEAAVENDMDAGSEVAGAKAGGAVQPDKDAYRLPEMPVAMWKPVLTSDDSGELQIQFVAPNYNTTWNVKALAYDGSMLNGYFNAEIVASKPVMVQPQLPRFMRVGDSIELRAMVMNNSDSLLNVTSFFEIYNPLTDEVLHTDSFDLKIEKGASSVITTRYTAPAETMVGIRVRATAGNFTDGEQTVLPILPASVDVRTGTPIFLPADSVSTAIRVPRGGSMTFTANAVWECIKALPGLQTSASKSALSLASSLFSAATARGLLRTYPAIGRAINQWQTEDSALVSHLQRNSDLKIAMLSSTPWVGAAQSVNERMARLDLLFNRKLIEKSIESNINDLAKLTENGGLKWVENNAEPSVWVTTYVLATIAQLNRMGYAPESKKLNLIVENALKYLDKEVAADFAMHKDNTYVEYTYIRSRFPQVRQSAPARRASAATVQYIVGNWRDMSVAEQPVAALILSENGYENTARQILESLRQREAWRRTWLYPVMLTAFSRIEPECKEVDVIRNYFISQKQGTEWGNGPEVSNLVAAILTSGTDWLVPAENQLSIKVDGNDLQPQQIISSLGEFRLDLPEGGNVVISKGRFPAWGGVFSHSVDSITDVAAYASPGLKISRTIEGDFKVGSKVTVKLTVEAAQPIDFVVVKQPRCAALEPVNQLPSTLWLYGLSAYREPCPTVTNWFFNRLAKGVTEISESFYVTAEGSFLLAPAEVQSQQAPEFQAHSSGMKFTVSE